MAINDDKETLKNQLFVIELGELLDRGNIEEAERLFEEANARGDVEKSLWEICPAIIARLNSTSDINNRGAFATCQKFLQILANECNAKETLLLLVERTESTQDEATFRSLLKPLGISAIRVGASRAIDWCAKSIASYVKNLPLPTNEKPSENGKIDETEESPTIARLILDYEAILSFLEPLVELSSLAVTRETKTRNHLLGLQLSLFGSPFCYLRREKNMENSVTRLFEKALKQISLLCGDFFKYHAIVDHRSRGRRREIVEEEEEEENDDPTANNILRNRRNVTELAWANYYYYVLNTDVGSSNLPCVYDFRYLLRGIYYTANTFLARPEYALVRKGLKIIDAIVNRIEERSVGHEQLEFPTNRDLLENLTRVMIYCDSDEDRKLALRLFRSCIDVFDYRGRYLAIINLYETANHSGIFSLLTSITKNCIINCLAARSNYFLHEKLERLMKKICRLPNGASSDLVEISDEVIAALNLLRFLIIRDASDETGIWRIIDDLRNDYLSPLREGIDLARAHWYVKVKDLKEENKHRRTISGDCEINISVGGQNLPMMPIVEKIKFCHRAVNALDVIESILVRVNECIEENREKIKRV